MTVIIKQISEIRPRIGGEFDPGVFHARTETIARAYELGRELHDGQLRMSGEPYFDTHCVWVGGFLDKLVENEAWTIAGLLHDAVEDQGESLERIKNAFPGTLGEEVAFIVDGVTKISHPRDGRSREIETLRKIAQFRDPGVFLVKLADKSHNLITLGHMPEHKRRQKATEAIRAYGKLAGILNCYRWRCWIEDMAFPYAEPETYKLVRSQIDADPRLEVKFINTMMRQLGELMETAGIDGRIDLVVNGYWQTWTKLRRLARARKTSMTNFRSINDLVSFRMVVNSTRRQPVLCPVYRLSTATWAPTSTRTASTITLPARKIAIVRCKPPPGSRKKAPSRWQSPLKRWKARTIGAWFMPSSTAWIFPSILRSKF